MKHAKRASDETALVQEARENANAQARAAHDRRVKKQALERINLLEQQLEDLLEIKNGIKTFTIRPHKSQRTAACPIWLASDWHVGERVTLGQTNGINQFNPKVARARAEAYFANGLNLTNLFGRDVDIDTIVLALLGDFITGHIHLSGMVTNSFPPIEETLFAQELLISGIEFILKNSKYKLVIPCHSGNHGRTTKQSEFGNENGFSHEFMMYKSMQQYFRNEPRVTFIISEGAHTYLDVLGYKVRFLHGHDVKFGGGVGGITIPLNKALAQWEKARPAYLTCLGHFHQLFDGGNFLVNGSLIGYNAYALSIKASAERPQQGFILLDRKRGRTITAPILVD
jgi:hypothetical protein